MEIKYKLIFCFFSVILFLSVGFSPVQAQSPKDPDLDGDGQVNQSDMRKLLLVWGSISSTSAEDLDSNGKVNSRDAGILMASWSGGPTPSQPQATPTPGYIDHAICNPDRGSAAFSSNITNQFLPFSTGMQNDHVIYNSSTRERVRFRILNQTKNIPGADGADPVQALVLEEYETVNGQWVETSHNWFVQTLDGTVCYLGEDVFLPGSPGGGGGGSWEAGVGGAKAGIMMPPNPMVGMTWMIEDAPNARENAEVFATGVTYTTPAGTFSNTIYIKEDFSGGQWNSFKRYSPGVGMIYDDGMVLTSY